jgi:hypothetical protein
MRCPVGIYGSRGRLDAKEEAGKAGKGTSQRLACVHANPPNRQFSTTEMRGDCFALAAE